MGLTPNLGLILLALGLALALVGAFAFKKEPKKKKSNGFESDLLSSKGRNAHREIAEEGGDATKSFTKE